MALVYPTKTAMPVLDPVERRSRWDEVAVGYTVERALAEARRCIQCQEPLCEQGCPVGVPIRDFIRRVAVEDFAGAVDLIRTRNALPAICGRVCPVEHQCEARCAVLGRLEPVGIGRLERFVADWERAHPRDGAAPGVAPRAEKIAIVGSGPAGLTAASDLAQLGYRRDRLRGAARGRRRPSLRHPGVPAAEGDRRRGRRAPARAGRRVRDRRRRRQDGDGRRAARRARILGRLRRHGRGLAEVHGHPGREPEGRLLGERVSDPREPDARLLVPGVRHAGQAADARGGDRRRRHRDGRGPRLDPPRRRGGAHRLPAQRAGDGRPRRGLPPRRRGRGDLRLADAADASSSPTRTAASRGLECVRTTLGEPDESRPPATGSGPRLGVRARGEPRRDRPRHEPEPARPADDARPRDRRSRLRRRPTPRPAPPAAKASTPAATSPPAPRP